MGCCTLSACGFEINRNDTMEEQSSEDTETLRRVTTEVDATKVSVGNAKKAQFGLEKFPILKEGKIVGWAQINFVEKLGIWDIYDEQAVQNGVKDSYAINLHIDMQKYLEEADTLALQCDPYLVSADSVIGVPCTIGWSGFSKVAELYKQQDVADIEVNVQPYVTDLSEDTLLRLDFSSADSSITFDSVYIKKSVLDDARIGANLLTIEDEREIESVNGAKYSLKIKDVFREYHKVDRDAGLGSKEVNFYDFSYKVKYTTGPINIREVLTFDSFNKNAITVPFKISVQADTDKTVLVDNVAEAKRKLWSNKTDTDYYVSSQFKPIAINDKETIWCNRVVPDSTSVDATYLRFSFEFPEEAEARSNEELMNFNGRYCIWQVPITERELEVKPR